MYYDKKSLLIGKINIFTFFFFVKYFRQPKQKKWPSPDNFPDPFQNDSGKRPEKHRIQTRFRPESFKFWCQVRLLECWSTTGYLDKPINKNLRQRPRARIRELELKAH